MDITQSKIIGTKHIAEHAKARALFQVRRTPRISQPRWLIVTLKQQSIAAWLHPFVIRHFTMDAPTAIREAEAKAKRQAIIDRLLEWIERAETVDIVRENPRMERENSCVTARMLPTGELTIELKLTGISGIEARVKNGGNRHESDDWVAV